MNAARTASICRQIGGLFLELAEALAEPGEQPAKKRRPVAPLVGSAPSKEAIDQVRRRLHRQGVAT